MAGPCRSAACVRAADDSQAAAESVREGQATASQPQGHAELHLSGRRGKRARHVSSSLLGLLL
jgi:hypothetical protein